MHTVEYEELAGRIDALADAVLHVTAELELMQLIDGPRLSRSWRHQKATHASASHVRKQATLDALGQLADLLDRARANRDHQ